MEHHSVIKRMNFAICNNMDGFEVYYGNTNSMDMSLGRFWQVVMDRDTWHAVVHGVTKSRTQLNDRTELMPREISQRKTSAVLYHLYVESKRQTSEYNQKKRGRETHRYEEQSVVASREKENGRGKTRVEN